MSDMNSILDALDGLRDENLGKNRRVVLEKLFAELFVAYDNLREINLSTNEQVRRDTIATINSVMHLRYDYDKETLEKIASRLPRMLNRCRFIRESAV